MTDLSDYQVYLAIMDKLGVKLFEFETTIEQDREDRSWAK